MGLDDDAVHRHTGVRQHRRHRGRATSATASRVVLLRAARIRVPRDAHLHVRDRTDQRADLVEPCHVIVRQRRVVRAEREGRFQIARLADRLVERGARAVRRGTSPPASPPPGANGPLRSASGSPSAPRSSRPCDETCSPRIAPPAAPTMAPIGPPATAPITSPLTTPMFSGFELFCFSAACSGAARTRAAATPTATFEAIVGQQ